jgi:hypothetical protein
MHDTPLIFYGADYDLALKSAQDFGGKCVTNFDFVELQVEEGKNYTKEQIVEFLSEVSLTPYQGQHKVYLFHHAERMLPVHANALLKTFEEKPNHAIILLVTDNIKGILETILSRSKKIYISNNGNNSERAATPLMIKALQAKAQNDLYSCLDILPELEATPLEEITDFILSWYRDLNLLKTGLDSSHLNHPEAGEIYPLCKQIPTLEDISQRVGKVKLASERYIRPKLILEYLFLT